MWPKYLDLRMEKGLVFDNDYWFVDIATNVLYKYSFEKKTVQLMLDISALLGHSIKDRSYTIGAIYKRRVIIFPVAGDCIIDYDIESKKAQIIKLNFDDIVNEYGVEYNFKFRSCVLAENKLWLVPAACHHIISINLDTNEINDYTGWYDALRSYNWQDKYLFGAGIYYNNSIWFPCFHVNIIVEFNIKNKLVKFHQIGLPDNIFSAICFKYDNLFALDCTYKQLYKINEVDQVIEKYDLPTEYDIDDNFKNVANGDKTSCCTIMEKVDDQIIGLPSYGNKFWIFSFKENKIFVISKKRADDVYISLDYYNGNLLIPSQNRGKVDLFDIKTYEIRNVIDKFQNEFEANNYNIVVHEKDNTLDDLIDYILN